MVEYETKVAKKVNITEKDFENYEKVRQSGKTNMFDLANVEMLSGLSKQKIRVIISNYEDLEKKFPEVEQKVSKKLEQML